ncbi:hypothetical protein CDD83_2625 [Cordyceps sp. RAO-2017]|nr:hypothetical protein CDD83_2625 [Cordyceps sp. RAO-2017]
MVGRKRRASTSSVESVDESQVRWRQETSVVRSVPKDLPSDDWPIFELRDAVVLHRDGQTVENALHVGIRGPYIVRGHLIIDDPSQKAHLIMRVRKSTPLEIRQCISYSIGESPDGSPLIWISGRGGWYEINPSPAYRPIYRKMCEATTLYYNLVDIYNSKQLYKKLKKAKQNDLMDELSRVFLQYAARVGDGCTFDEVIARCSEHAGFFICQFAQLESLIDWRPTAFYKWLAAEHSDLFRTIENLMKNPLKLSPAPSVDALSPRPREGTSVSLAKSVSVEATDSRDTAPKRRSRMASSIAPQPAENGTPNVRPPPAPQPVKEPPRPSAQPAADSSAQPSAGSAAGGGDDDDSPFASILNAIEGVYDALSGTKRGLTTLSVFNKLYFGYRFPNYRDGTVGCHKIPVREVMHYNASALLQHLDKSRFEKHEIYSRERARRPHRRRSP